MESYLGPYEATISGAVYYNSAIEPGKNDSPVDDNSVGDNLNIKCCGQRKLQSSFEGLVIDSV